MNEIENGLDIACNVFWPVEKVADAGYGNRSVAYCPWVRSVDPRDLIQIRV
jgi:hypothetical protein